MQKTSKAVGLTKPDLIEHVSVALTEETQRLTSWNALNKLLSNG